MSMYPEQTVSRSAEQTLAEGRKLAAALSPGDVVTISGELGAGKTVFCKGVAAGLGVEPDMVSSPSFAIVNEYQGARTTVLHVDFYRLSGSAEAERIGWQEYLQREAIMLIEWPEIAPDILPERRVEVSIKFLMSENQKQDVDSERVIEITKKTGRSANNLPA